MLDNLTIRMKLMLLGAASSSLILALGSTGIWNVYTLQDTFQHSDSHAHILRNQALADVMRESVRSDVLNACYLMAHPDQIQYKKKKLLNDIQSHTRGLKRALEALEHAALSAEARSQTAVVHPLIETYATHAEKITAAALDGKEALVITAMATFSTKFDQLDEEMDKLNLLFENYSLNSRQESLNIVKVSYRNLGALILISLVLTMLIAWRINLNILKRIQTVSDVINRIAHGDLRQPIDTSISDEMGEVLKSLQKMQEHLRSTLRIVFDSSRRVLHASETFRGMVSEIAESSSSQAESTTLIASSSQAFNLNVNGILDKTGNSQGAVHESTQICDHSLTAMTGALNEMNNIVEVVERASTQVQELETSSSKISEIAQVIKEIADQTSLLALNAAIEAARAGEQGRGFAVVADEVRKLSERTADSTIQITTMIEEIMVGISEAVSTMQVGTEHVQQGVKVTQDAHEAMSQISTANQNMIQLVQDISNSLREQNASSSAMADNIAAVSTIAEKNTATTQDAAISVDRLKELADDLKKATDTFQVG